MNIEEMEVVEKRIGYEFNEMSVLQQAFVRKSYGVEHDCAHNEILEFIGDKVLDLAVIQLLVEEHCSMTTDGKYQQQKKFYTDMKTPEPNVLHSNKTEGELTEIKKALVQRKNLARRIDELGLIKFIAMSQSDRNNHVEENASTKEDLFEAILGAVVIDCDWDMKVLKNVVDHMLQPNLSKEDDNYIQKLQEWSQKKHGVLPVYSIEPYSTNYWHRSDYIYDMSRNIYMDCSPGYIAHLKVLDIPKTILGFGITQSEARQDAARYALKVLEEKDMLYSMSDEIGEPNRDLAISQLEILSRRGYFVLPEYNFEETYDKNGNPIWHCVVCIPNTKAEFSADSSSKKDAKKEAAFKLLMYLLNE
ncbi:MAG: hypothetical protein K6D38_09340 [Pseudobutyrivibrio sp.]|nr:hypothetical protein [Pseudobutyrivibrio sp.]